ncbi:hypothetical protein BD769DRAFT_1392241 [Suillus cothurnatus]|nr:hypothetical protein BD769DRAFT_1392241 [Suillus cothurnatus]
MVGGVYSCCTGCAACSTTCIWKTAEPSVVDKAPATTSFDFDFFRLWLSTSAFAFGVETLTSRLPVGTGYDGKSWKGLYATIYSCKYNTYDKMSPDSSLDSKHNLGQPHQVSKSTWHRHLEAATTEQESDRIRYGRALGDIVFHWNQMLRGLLQATVHLPGTQIQCLCLQVLVVWPHFEILSNELGTRKILDALLSVTNAHELGIKMFKSEMIPQIHCSLLTLTNLHTLMNSQIHRSLLTQTNFCIQTNLHTQTNTQTTTAS